VKPSQVASECAHCKSYCVDKVFCEVGGFCLGVVAATQVVVLLLFLARLETPLSLGVGKCNLAWFDDFVAVTAGSDVLSVGCNRKEFP
jgi:hypothetical protein